MKRIQKQTVRVPVRRKMLRVTVDVKETQLGTLIVQLTDQGYAIGRVEVIEDVPLGHSAVPATGKEIVLKELQDGAKPTGHLVVMGAQFGKGKATIYSALNALKKDKAVRQNSNKDWELVR